MNELRTTQVEPTMAQTEFLRSMAEMDYSKVSLLRFLVKNEISQPPQEKMTNLKPTMVEWIRAQAEFTTSQAQFMEEVNQPLQEELILENEVEELAISMAELAKSRTKLFMEERKAIVQFQSIPLKSLEETMTPKAVFHP